MSKISVIIPVYKVEKYLNRCVDSVINQTYKDLEIILVDDGSPDECPKICDEYAAKDSRIKVLHKPNGGVSSARNAGLDIASGDYITFVDADDYIEICAYEKMIKRAEDKDVDVLLCDCVKDYGEKTELYSHNIRSGYYNRNDLESEYFKHLIMMENVEYPATISNWLLLFKRSLLNAEQKIKYVEGVRFSEDLLFGAELMYHANSFYYMKGEAYYRYAINPDSATHSFKKDKWNDYLKLYHEAKSYFLPNEKYDFAHQIDLMLLFFIYNVIGDVKNSDLAKNEKKRIIKAVLTSTESKTVFKNIKIHKLPITFKLKILTYLYKFGIVWI